MLPKSVWSILYILAFKTTEPESHANRCIDVIIIIIYYHYAVL